MMCFMASENILSTHKKSDNFDKNLMKDGNPDRKKSV